MEDQTKVFISYSRRHRRAQRELRNVLESAGFEVSDDSDMAFSAQWWSSLFEMISEAHIVIFMVSEEANSSVVCRAECEYAKALGIQIVPIHYGSGSVEEAPFLRGMQVHVWPRTDVPAIVQLIAGLQAMVMPRLTSRSLAKIPDSPGFLREAIDEHLQALPQSATEFLVAARRWLEEFGGDEWIRAQLSHLAAKNEIKSLDRQIEELKSLAWGTGDISEVRGLVASALEFRTSAANSDRVTPVVGPGVSDLLFNRRVELALGLAEMEPYAVLDRDAHEPPLVAQFRKVMSSDADVRQQWRRLLWRNVRSDAGVPTPNWDDLRQAMAESLDSASNSVYSALAAMNCPLYVTTLPTLDLEEAIRASGREPRVVHCDWTAFRPNSNGIASQELDDDEPLSLDRPIVCYLHGSFHRPDLIPLTEDDYLDFLMAAALGAVPAYVSAASVESNLLLIGFDMLHWETRVVLRAMGNTFAVSTPFPSQRAAFNHIAIHDDIDERVSDRKRARSFVDRFLRAVPPGLSTCWISPAAFGERANESIGRLDSVGN